MEQLKSAWYWAREYNDEGLHIILMVIGLIYLAMKKEEKKHRCLMIGYTVTLLALYFFPPVVWFMDKVLGNLVYWRMLWMLPAPVMIAYCMVKMWDSIGSRWIKGVFLIGLIISLQLMGQNVYTENSPYFHRDNFANVPSSTVAIADIINAHRETPDEWALVAAPMDQVINLVQYDASIRLVYGRKGASRSAAVKRMIQADTFKYRYFCKKLRKINCNYVVLPKKGSRRLKRMKRYGFKKIGRVGDYIVFKDMQWTPEN